MRGRQGRIRFWGKIRFWGTVLVCMLLLGACGDTSSPPLKVSEFLPEPEATVLAISGEREEWQEAVGTVRPRTESSIEAQIAGQVREVAVRSGSRVEKGDPLILLDDRQVRARMEQAREALSAAESGRQQTRQAIAAADAALDAARADHDRIQGFFAQGAATQRQVEQATSAFRQAEAHAARAREGLLASEASIRQAREVLREAEIAHGYTRITAPESGEVLKRLVEPGDTAVPGKPLLLLQTSGFLRLEAYVREGLFSKVKPGEQLWVRINTLNAEFPAEVEEVVPYADPKSRTFLVKVALPVKEGLYPGMFGTLRIPVGSRAAVWIEEDAIRKVGQLALVEVQVEDRWERRFVTTGERMGGGMIEILSGLEGGEKVALSRGRKDS